MEKEQPRNPSRVQFHCLPLISPGQYGTKFVFDGADVEQSDFQYMFWSQQQLTTGSIVYPKTMHKRWWRVEQQSPYERGGFLTLCNISTICPDFSQP